MADLATTDLAHAPFTWKTLNMIADTVMVPRGLRGNPAAMYAAIMMGRELDLGPMQSMQMIDVIDGRPSLSAELQTAMIRSAGHSITASVFTDHECSISGRRVDNGDEMEVSFTIEMAERAGLLSKRNWQQYPEAMLWARAVSMLARMLFADVFAVMHVYTPEELGSSADVPTVEGVAIVEEAHGDTTATNLVEVPEADDRESAAASERLEATLVDALAVNIRSAKSKRDIEAVLRTMCRVAEALGLVHAPQGAKSWLHGMLAGIGHEHVGSLTRVELENFTMSIRHDISDRYTRFLDEERKQSTPDAP